MPSTMHELGIDRLSVEDRLALMHEIWDSLAEAIEESPLTEEEKLLLDQRCADLDAHPENVLTWEEIRTSVVPVTP